MNSSLFFWLYHCRLSALFPVFIILANMASPFLSARAEPPPDPPLIVSTPTPFAWTIEVQHRTPRPDPPTDPVKAASFRRAMAISPRIVRITVDKADNAWRRESIYENQTKDTQWHQGNVMLLQGHHFPPDNVIAIPMDASKATLGKDFPELDWIHPEVYVKKESHLGRLCYFYEEKKGKPINGRDPFLPAPSGSITLRAWIDVKSRLPIAFEDDELSLTYSYRPGPVTLEPNGPFAAAYDRASGLQNPK